jgi:hypothetical protein
MSEFLYYVPVAPIAACFRGAMSSKLKLIGERYGDAIH